MRRRGRPKARTVEECTNIDLGRLASTGLLQPGRSGPLSIPTLSFRCSVPVAQEALILTLTYMDGNQLVNEPITLETTPLHFGGVRWWGRCPLTTSAGHCGRRVLKLYRPPGARYFGCRVCHGLTYRSVQQHDARVDRLIKNPQALEALAAKANDLSSVGNIHLMSLLTDVHIKLQRREARKQARAGRKRRPRRRPAAA